MKWSENKDMAFSWGRQKRYHSYPEMYRSKFGMRVQKVAVDAGFTCPNRDGKSGRGGCTYCNNDAFNPSYCHKGKNIGEQVHEGIEFHRTRYRRARQYLVYFQTYSNTYAPLEELMHKYEEALSCEGVIGLVIGTRPDCVEDEKLDYLSELAKKYYIKVEYGIESVRDETLQAINRGHSFAESVDALRRTHARGIPAGAHFIIGLPGENEHTLREDISVISSLSLESIKFHQLQIIKGTAMEIHYRNYPGAFHMYELAEYLDLLTSLVERLNPAISIERIAAEVPPRYLASPAWERVRYDEVLRLFGKKLEEKNTWQGRLYQKNQPIEP